MSLAGFRAQNHPQQVGKRGPDDTVDDRETGPDTWAECVERWGPFDLDVAAAPHNAKCDRFYTLADDALRQPWDAESVWCNPPYSDLVRWVMHAKMEVCNGRAERVTMLLPANRTEQSWWQDHIEPMRDGALPKAGITTHFLRGRRRFIKAGATEIKPNERPPFGLVVVRFEGTA